MSAVLKDRETRGRSTSAPAPSNHARRALGPETVVFGIGNCGRGDDGLGWAFLDRLRREAGFNCPVEYRYQMQVEDAALIAGKDRVVFVDSFHGVLEGGFAWAPCEASELFEFTTHVLPPRGVMHYCRELFGHTPQAEVLMIQGREWGLRNGMSAAARRNLDAALEDFSSRFLPNV